MNDDTSHSGKSGARSGAGARTLRLSQLDVPDADLRRLPKFALRSKPPRLPEFGELDLIRHYEQLAQQDPSLAKGASPFDAARGDSGLEMSRAIAQLKGFADIHPEQDAGRLQGALGMLKAFEHDLAEITGLPCVSLQPSSCAQGELAAHLIAKAHFQALRQAQRTKALLFDSAHAPDLASQLNDDTAVVMIFHSSDLGFFDTDLAKICEAVHESGALVCMDGAHLHTIMGIARPADLGVDMQIIDLHEMFATRAGGAGPLCVRQELERYLPSPRIVEEEEGFHLDYDAAPSRVGDSIGMLRSWAGDLEELLCAYVNLRRLGAEGIRRVAEDAFLHAHFIRHNLPKS